MRQMTAQSWWHIATRNSESNRWGGCRTTKHIVYSGMPQNLPMACPEMLMVVAVMPRRWFTQDSDLAATGAPGLVLRWPGPNT